MIPQHTKYALTEWVRVGNQYDHGSFLMALVSNDLLGAFQNADDINLYAMLDIVRWMYSRLPASSFGSINAVENWKGLSDTQFEEWNKREILKDEEEKR